MNKPQAKLPPEHVTLTARLTRQAAEAQDLSIITAATGLTPKQRFYLVESVLIQIMVDWGVLDHINKLWIDPEMKEAVATHSVNFESVTTAKYSAALAMLEEELSEEFPFVAAAFEYLDNHALDGNLQNYAPGVYRISMGGGTTERILKSWMGAENNLSADELSNFMAVALRQASSGMSHGLEVDGYKQCPHTGKKIPTTSLGLKIKNIIFRTILDQRQHPSLKKPSEIARDGDGVCPAVSSGRMRILVEQTIADMSVGSSEKKA